MNSIIDNITPDEVRHFRKPQLVVNNPLDTVMCPACQRRFFEVHDLQQHRRHSHKCRARAFRISQETETRIRLQMAKSPEDREQDLRKALENVRTVATCFGSVQGDGIHDHALAALDTIVTMATIALMGDLS